MKTFVLAPDSFKESMTAEQACQAMQRGILQVFPDANCITVPMADGGEGTVDALISSLKG
ncbi:glycerate kinase, partial [Acinetobacter variabilis]|uniref:glycerate kinase n=2 Tax=Acinetobacter TaxID=469 RepID=UPI0028988727